MSCSRSLLYTIQFQSMMSSEKNIDKVLRRRYASTTARISELVLVRRISRSVPSLPDYRTENAIFRENTNGIFSHSMLHAMTMLQNWRVHRIKPLLLL